MGQNIVTIQLTVPALEKLFENEPEFKLSIQKAAIIEFAKRSMSGLMDESMRAQINHEVAQQVGKMTRKDSWSAPRIELQPEILELVRSEARLMVAKELESLRAEISSAADAAVKQFKSTIESKFKAEFREQVNVEVKKRVAAVMNAAASAAEVK